MDLQPDSEHAKVPAVVRSEVSARMHSISENKKAGSLPQILTIQSGVMWGEVGNDAAMPIYQHDGLHAIRLDTVRLAAHPGYGTTYASVTPAVELAALFADFSALDASRSLRICQTGYLGQASQCDVLAREIAALKQKNPQLLYCLDPVLGDGGRMYVSTDIATAMMSHLLPLADILTPNQFELSLITQTDIPDTDGAITAAARLCERSGNPELNILVTGVSEPAWPDEICDILVSRSQQIIVRHQRNSAGVSGAGDALTALYLSHLVRGASSEQAMRAASAKASQLLSSSPSQRDIGLRQWLASSDEDRDGRPASDLPGSAAP